VTARAAALSCLLGAAAACGPSDAAPPATERALGGDLVARAGSETVAVDTVRRVASAQAISPKEALDRALFDAVLAAEAKAKLSSADQQHESSRVHARLMLAELGREARAQGAPTDAEVEAKTKKYWVRVARPASVVTGNAVVLVPKGAAEAEWAKAERIAKKIAEAVTPTAEPLKKPGASFDFEAGSLSEPSGALGAFIAAAKAVDAEGMRVSAEYVPPISADNYTVIKAYEDRTAFDADYVAAAQKLAAGEIVSPVRSAHGVHVILGVLRIPAEDISLEERRKRFADEIYSDRTRALTNDLLAQLRKQHAAELERSADASLAEVVLSSGFGAR
jgi:hypothetical protein